MKVEEVMQKDVISVKIDMSVTEAAMVLLKHNITGAPVVEADGKLAGVVSEKDIFKFLYPDYHEYYSFLGFSKEKVNLREKIKEGEDKPVKDVMTRQAIYVSPQDSVMRVGALMVMKKIHRVMVVDRGKLIGIVSRKDVYHQVFQVALDKQ